MPDLYIVGAGSSRNYSQSTHRIAGLESPLDGDFFRMARLVIENTGMKNDQLFMEEVENLIKALAPKYGNPKTDLSFFDDPQLRLEQTMTLLDNDFKLFSQGTPPRFRLNESYETRILKELLTRTLDYALMGPLCNKHLALAQEMGPGDVVLSFNYDILLDNALYHEGRMTDFSYRMNFFKTNEDGNWNAPDEQESKVILFKLHGSLNWVRCGLCGVLLLYRYKKQALSGAIPFQCPRCSSEDLYGERMMIPPVQSKDYRDRDMAFLWLEADRIMRDFSRIICIGYSFSPLDSDMTSLLRRFRARRTTIPEVDFVSPDPEARKRLTDLLGVKEARPFRSLKSYLENT
jgi:hypothetical protein